MKYNDMIKNAKGGIRFNIFLGMEICVYLNEIYMTNNKIIVCVNKNAYEIDVEPK